MKTILLTSVTFLLCAACATSRPRPPIISTRPIAQADTSKQPPATLRSSERIVAYPFSRYIDPNHSDILHEAHTVYRIERHPHWNLRCEGDTPRSGATANAVIRIPCVPNERPVGGNLTREEWLVELQRQKAAGAELLKVNQTLQSRVAELDAGVALSARDTESRARLEKGLQAAEERLSRLESATKSGAPSETSDLVPRGSNGSAPRTPQKSPDWNW